MQVIASVTHTRVSDLVHEEQDLVADLVLEVLVPKSAYRKFFNLLLCSLSFHTFV